MVFVWSHTTRAFNFVKMKYRALIYIYTMMKSYIKGIPRCIFTLLVGWYVSYTPHKYYAHLRNVLVQLITSPLVAIIIDKQSFQLRWLAILFTSVFVPHLITNLCGSIDKQTFHFVQLLLPFIVKAEIWIHRSRDLTWLPTVASKCCRTTWQRDTVSAKYSYRFLLYNLP